LLVGLACFLKLLHSSVNAATGVEARLKVVVVKLDVEGFQVEVNSRSSDLTVFFAKKSCAMSRM
jgi:hypothetical protein